MNNRYMSLRLFTVCVYIGIIPYFEFENVHSPPMYDITK